MAGVTTLCWDCHYAAEPKACSWADHLQPRTDWQATRSDTSGGESYNVRECPQFISDKEWKEKEASET